MLIKQKSQVSPLSGGYGAVKGVEDATVVLFSSPGLHDNDSQLAGSWSFAFTPFQSCISSQHLFSHIILLLVLSLRYLTLISLFRTLTHHVLLFLGCRIRLIPPIGLFRCIVRKSICNTTITQSSMSFAY